MQPPNSGPLIISGASGFIGSHVSAALSAAGRPFTGIDRVPSLNGARKRTLQADISDLRPLSAFADGRQGGIVIHLAAEAEVVMPWNQIPCAFLSNLNGTWNLLTAFSPRVCLFASSSSIYGNAGIDATAPRWSGTHPLGLYASTKLTDEILLRDWASGTDSAAVIFRLGNVIGPRCRGLIPYLVNHARLHPDGSVPAQLRGQGKLARDYVPVRYVAAILVAALDLCWKPGRAELFNVGTGRGLTNGDVAAIVQRTLASRGYRLEIVWDNPVATGEAHSVVLDVASLVRRFGLLPPGAEEVESAIEQSALEYLGA